MLLMIISYMVNVSNLCYRPKENMKNLKIICRKSKMEKDDEENQKIHFCLPVCGNVCQHVSVCRLSEKAETIEKEKTDRTVALLGYSG